MASEDNNQETNPQPAEAVAEAAPEMAQLQKDLEAAQAKTAEYLEGWQRSRAEFANYKRRVEKEQAETYQNAAARIIARYLDVLDDFDRAMADRPTEGEAAKWAEGINLIYRKLQNILESEGVTRIEAEGKEFDPTWHEAVTHEESDSHAPGHIIAVLRQGYKLGDRVIRPALVRVAR
jgi:molecular chaperone GrpE